MIYNFLCYKDIRNVGDYFGDTLLWWFFGENFFFFNSLGDEILQPKSIYMFCFLQRHYRTYFRGHMKRLDRLKFYIGNT